MIWLHANVLQQGNYVRCALINTQEAATMRKLMGSLQLTGHVKLTKGGKLSLYINHYQNILGDVTLLWVFVYVFVFINIHVFFVFRKLE